MRVCGVSCPFVNRLFYSDTEAPKEAAITSSLEDDTVSVLSELTDISEPRAPGDSDGPDTESEIEVSSALRALHHLTFAALRFHSLRQIRPGGWFASRVPNPVAERPQRVSSPPTQTSPNSPVSLIPSTAFQTLDGVDVYAQKVRGTKDATFNVFESIGEAEVVTPPFLPKYLVAPMDLYIHRWSGGVQVWLFGAEGWNVLRVGDAHPVFSDRRFFIRRSESPRWLKMSTHSRMERSAMRFSGLRYRS